jgi:ATP-dependent Clp protease protease subunit
VAEDNTTALTKAQRDERHAAELARLAAETRKFEADAAASESLIPARLRSDTKDTASFREWEVKNANRTLYLMDEVDEFSTRSLIDTLSLWSRLHPGDPIELIINSPGGSIVDGLALFDYIQMMRRNGHHVTTMALGMAASMGGVLLQAGDTRVMTKESWLMLHEAAFGARGKTSTVEDTVEWVKKVQDRLLDIFAERSTMPRTRIKANWSRKDWWLSSDEALKAGFIDEVR